MKIIINHRIRRSRLWLATLVFSSVVLPQIADATIVEIDTNMGVVTINLFDNDTPATVTNFLFYVNEGRYTNSIFHRSVPDFIVQGGGFTFATMWPPIDILAAPAVINEPVFSNVRGTIAMAKLGSGPNTATSQWFINMADNSGNLDNQNGGFTAFGQVDVNGMAVMEAIAAVGTSVAGGAFNNLPLQNFSGTSVNDITAANLMIVNSITISDSTVDTAAGLSPVLSTAPPSSGDDPADPADNSGGGGGGGGGGFGFFTLFALLLTYRLRRA